MRHTVPSDAGKSEATRNRLLAAAIQIASTKGLDKVTYRSVGAEAGLSHSLVRFYFGTRDALLDEALERAGRLDVEESHLRAHSLEAFLDDFVHVVSGQRNRSLLQYEYLLRAVRGGASRERVLALYDLSLREVSATLEEIGIQGVDEPLAALVFAAIDGLVLQHAIYGSEQRSQQIVDRLREVLVLVRAASTAV